MTRLLSACVALALAGCTGNPVKMDMNPDMASDDAAPAIVGQHGQVVDYFTLQPLAGFTVTDGPNSTTTDAAGKFVLPAPAGTVLQPMVTGPDYSTLQLPAAMADGDDFDRGILPIPSAMTFGTEQQILSNDPSKALVQVTVVRTGACASVQGGTLTVNSPAGVSVSYFDKSGLPLASSFTDTTAQRPVAVLYNVPPGEKVSLTLDMPSCTEAPAGTVTSGATFTGDIVTLPCEPGDHNSALAVVVQ
jgi:hypothetical protein